MSEPVRIRPFRPGDEPALMTTLDGYPMARKGQVSEALALSGVASFVGSIIRLHAVAKPAVNLRLRPALFRELCGLLGSFARAVYDGGR